MLKNIFKKQPTKLVINQQDKIILSLGVVVFAFISLLNITKSSIWFDEAFGAYMIRFNFWEIVKYTANDVHPPLYYWLLKLWSYPFGTSEFALRSMSTFFACVAIVFAFLLTHKLFGRRAAWISLPLMVLSPMVVRYSEEMRMYSLVAAIAFAATYVLTYAVETNRRKHWVIYGVLVALGMWTHTFAALVWLSHWVWRAWVIRRDNKKIKKFTKAFFAKEWIVAHAVAIGVFLPWLPVLIYQAAVLQGGGFWIPRLSVSTLPNFFTNVLYYQDQDLVQPWLAVVFMLVVAVTIGLSMQLYRVLDESQKRSYMLIASIAFVPVILLTVGSLPPLRSVFIERYLIPSILAMSVFAGITLALSSKFMRLLYQKLAMVLLIGVSIFGIYNVYYLGNYSKTARASNSTREIMDVIKDNALDGQPIIADSPWLFYDAAFYETPAHPVYFIDANTKYLYGSLDMLKYNDDHKIKNLDTFSKDNATVWYVGLPRGGTFDSPNKSWQAVKVVEIKDPIDNKPSYRAVQYRTN